MKLARSVLLLALAFGGVASARPGNNPVHAQAALSRAAAQTTIPVKLNLKKSTVKPRGTVNFAQLAAAKHTINATSNRQTALAKKFARFLEPKGYGTHQATHAVPALSISQSNSILHPGLKANGSVSPNIAGTPILNGVTGFPGLSNFDQGTLNGLSVEPPDGGLCAGNGVAMQTVNQVAQIYNPDGSTPPGGGPVSLLTFFGLDPALNFVTYIFSDPQCYYDAPTGRWFISALVSDLATFSFTLIGVSDSSDPTGTYALYAVDSSDGGVVLGDQPGLGADASAIYISTRSFDFVTSAFLGTDVFVISKAGLETAGGGLVNSVELVTDLTDPDGNPADHVNFPQPTPGSITNNFISAPYTFSFFSSDNRLAVFTVIGDNTIDTTQTFFADWSVASNVMPYINPFFDVLVGPQGDVVTQEAGPTPLGTFLGSSENGLQANDDGIIVSRYAAGVIDAAWNTGVSGPNQGFQEALRYAQIRTSIVTILGTPVPVLSVLNDGVVSPGSPDSAMTGTMTGNAKGQHILSFTLVGPDFFPSAAYVAISPSLLQHNNSMVVSGPGNAPEDGFTCYPVGLGFPPADFPGAAVGCRWGDYNGATTDTDGTFWLESEMIDNTQPLFTGDGPGGGIAAANWDTWITHGTPGTRCIKPGVC